jgi:hypothetical protein
MYFDRHFVPEVLMGDSFQLSFVTTTQFESGIAPTMTITELASTVTQTVTVSAAIAAGVCPGAVGHRCRQS